MSLLSGLRTSSNKPELLQNSPGTIVSDATTDFSYDVTGGPVSRSVLTDSVVGMELGLGLGLPQSSTIDTFKQVEMERRNEVLDQKQTESPANHYDVLREQISSMAREVGSIRQDINTLRLADSQHEVQGAEMSRHLREMQAQLRAEIVAEARARAELEAQIDIKINVVADEARGMQGSTRAAQGFEEHFRREFSVIEERTFKLSEAIEAERCERAGDRKEFLAALDAEGRARAVGLGELAVDSRRSLEEQQRSVMGSIDALEERIQKELGSHKQEMIINVTNVREKMTEQVGRERAEREKVHAAFLEQVNDVHYQLQHHASKTRSDFESRSNSMSKAIADLERKLNDGALTSKSIEAVDAVEKRMREELNSHAGEHRSRHNEMKVLINKTISDSHNWHSELKDRLHSSTAQEQVAREEMVRSIMCKVEELSSQLRKDLVDHKSGFNTQHGEIRDAIGQERQHREKHHNTVLNRLEEMDRKVRDVVTNSSRDDGSHISHSDLSALDRKLRDELASLANDHHRRHLELKDQLGKFHMDHNGRYSEVQEMLYKGIGQHTTAQDDLRSHFTGTLQELEGRLRREIGDSKQGIDTHQSSIREYVVKERQDRESNHSSILERIEDVDRKVKDAISQLSGSQESHHDLSGQLSALERKVSAMGPGSSESELKDVIAGAIAEERAHTQALLANEQEQRVVIQEQLNKRIEQEKSQLEGQQESLRNFVNSEKMSVRSWQQDLLVTRKEFETSLRRVWEAVGVGAQPVATQRIVVPPTTVPILPPPGGVTAGTHSVQAMVYNPHVGLPPQTALSGSVTTITGEGSMSPLRSVATTVKPQGEAQLFEGSQSPVLYTRSVSPMPGYMSPFPPVATTVKSWGEAQRVEGSQSPVRYKRSVSPMPGDIASKRCPSPLPGVASPTKEKVLPAVLVPATTTNAVDGSPVAGSTQIIGMSTSPSQGSQKNFVFPVQAK